MKILREQDVNPQPEQTIFSVELLDAGSINVKVIGALPVLSTMIAHVIAGNKDGQQCVFEALRIFCHANNIPLSSIESIINGDIYIMTKS